MTKPGYWSVLSRNYPGEEGDEVQNLWENYISRPL
jgi:hypothetical protein